MITPLWKYRFYARIETYICLDGPLRKGVEEEVAVVVHVIDAQPE